MTAQQQRLLEIFNSMGRSVVSQQPSDFKQTERIITFEEFSNNMDVLCNDAFNQGQLLALDPSLDPMRTY